MSQKSHQDPQLQAAIDDLYRIMDMYPAHSDEYKAAVAQLGKLYPLKEDNSKRQVSPDTLVIVAGNLIGIAVIIFHERAEVISSKALGFVMKLR